MQRLPILCAVALIAVVAAVANAAASVAPDSYVLQYSVGNATPPVWRHKATLLVTEHRVRPEDTASAWTYADVRGLRDGQPYRLRVVAAGDADASNPHVFASARFSPCTLLTAKQYANTPLKGTYERIGLALSAPRAVDAAVGSKKKRVPTGLRMMSNFVDTVCELAVFAPALKQAQKAAGRLEPAADEATGLQMGVVVQAASPTAAPPLPPVVGPSGKPQQAQGQQQDGAKGPSGEKDPAEPDNRTFFEKYWLYIVMFLGYSVVSALFAPPPQQQGADGKGGAAPAAKK